MHLFFALSLLLLLQDDFSSVTRVTNPRLSPSAFEMARVVFPRRRSATPSTMPAGDDADNNGNGAASACSPPSSSSARAPSLLSNPASVISPTDREASASGEASENGNGNLSSQSKLEIPQTTPTLQPSTSAVSALQAAVARRQQARAASSSSSPSPPLAPAEIERLWEEDHNILLSAVEALVSSAGKGGGASAAAALPATPSADRRRGRRRPRPPSSGPTPPPPTAKATGRAEGGEESSDLTRPVALWLRNHEPLLKEAAAAAAEARTFDTEAALLSLCAREGIAPEKLAEECAKLSSTSLDEEEHGSRGTATPANAEEGRRNGKGNNNNNPLGIDVAAALDRASELRNALSHLDEDARGDAPGFVTAADEETLRVRYRHIKGTKEHTVRFEATVMAPLEHLLALCSEIDLSPGWNRFVVDAAVVARTAAFCSFYYASQWSPRPFPQMDSCVRVRGHDAYDSESARGAVMCLESWPRDKGKEKEGENSKSVSLNMPAAAAKRHRVMVLPGSCIVLAPIRNCPVTGAKRTRGILLVTLDPGLPFVPSFLVAWVLRVLAPAIKRGIDAVMASWFVSDEEAAAVPDASRGAGSRSSAVAGKRGGAEGAEMRRRLVNRPELYELAKRLVARHAEERGGGLPPSPPRLVPRASAGAGGGGLWRSSSDIPAGAAAASLLRRRSSSSVSAIPVSVSAIVDGAIARLSRMSGGGGDLGVGGGPAATATTTTTERPPPSSSSPSSEEDQGWISWLARPLSATASYASSLLFVEQRGTTS